MAANFFRYCVFISKCVCVCVCLFSRKSLFIEVCFNSELFGDIAVVRVCSASRSFYNGWFETRNFYTEKKKQTSKIVA